MTNKIKFIAQDKYAEEVCPKPYPSSQALPKWWKNSTPYVISEDNPEGKKIFVNNRISNTNFKKCTPMLDALATGYIFPLWADVQVRNEPIGKSLNWRVSKPVFNLHGEVDIEIPEGYSTLIFKYVNMWHIQTPPGYSILVTHPLGYNNSAFRAIPAIIDTDKSQHSITVPMWVKEDFEGIVETGTPMFQVTPFKRDNWESEFDVYEEGRFDAIQDRNVFATIVNNYVKNNWTKKSYK